MKLRATEVIAKGSKKKRKRKPMLPTSPETSAREVERLQAIAAEHNASLTPEQSGTVRVDGLRRQYRAEVRGGVLHYIEI